MKSSRSPVRTLAMVAPLLIVGCAGDDGGSDGDDGMDDSGTTDADGEGDTGVAGTFTDVQAIFDANCVPGCHTAGGTADLQIHLDAGEAYANIVDQPAVGKTGEILVIPGDSANSYLMKKIDGAPDIVGVQMPNTGTVLPSSTANIIRSWIDDGAPNN